MGLIGWLAQKLGKDIVPLSGHDLEEAMSQVANELYYRELAFWTATNLVANTVGKCEFKTFLNGKETKDREYYRWNISPNKNQNSSAFIRDWVSKLFRHNECLIIETADNQLVVADSFIRKPYALYDDIFTQVTVGDFTFNRSFAQSEVLYFQLYSQDMRVLLANIYENYAKLITYTMKAYQKSRGTKVTLKYDTLLFRGEDEARFFDLVNNKIAPWLKAENGALPLGRGQDLKELSSKTYSSESTRDIRAMIDDIGDFTAKAFGIPPALLRGDIQGTSDAMDQYLTFFLDPFIDMVQEEINRKGSGLEGLRSGTYVSIDTKAVKHIDLLSVSTAIDKLISSGAFTINDIRKLVGEQPIDERWADAHYMTKNYDPLSEKTALGGGGES